MRSNQTQNTTNFDQFAQGMWSFADRWDLHAGIRHTTLSMKIFDNIGSGSGNLEFNKTIPVAGLVFKATPTVNFYANIGKGFETPTMVEISYNDSTNPTGPNLGIKPSTSTNLEVGTKWIVSDSTRLNLALFNIATENEIVIDRSNSSSGYTTYKNAGKTKRNGLEISAESKLSNNFSIYGAYTLLNASYDSDFRANNLPITAGKQIPGTYRSQLYAEAAWKYQPLNFQTAVEGRYNSKVYATDNNSASLNSYTIFNVRASFKQVIKSWEITEYARVENILDEKYVGSVRVNDTNSRFYEPAAGRNWMAGVKAKYIF